MFSVCGGVFYDDGLYFFYNEHDCTEESLVLVDDLHVCCLAPRTCRFIVLVVQCQKGFLPDINRYNFSAFCLGSQTSAVYESIVPLAVSLGECVWESGVLSEGFQVLREPW